VQGVPKKEMFGGVASWRLWSPGKKERCGVKGGHGWSETEADGGFFKGLADRYTLFERSRRVSLSYLWHVFTNVDWLGDRESLRELGTEFSLLKDGRFAGSS
jgi:hypothetical protein